MRQTLLRGSQDVGQIVRGRAGISQVARGAADHRAGIGSVVGPDTAGLVLDMQPAVQLAKQLRKPTGQHDQLGDQPVKLRRPGQGVRTTGPMVQPADRLRSPLSQLQTTDLCPVLHAQHPLGPAGNKRAEHQRNGAQTSMRSRVSSHHVITWGLPTGQNRGPHLATSGDFSMATGTASYMITKTPGIVQLLTDMGIVAVKRSGRGTPVWTNPGGSF